MRIYEILFEDIWSDVVTKWADRDKIGVDDVRNTINIFRRLVTTGKITSTNEKNIQYWSKKLFREFQLFVDENKHKLETDGATKRKIKLTRNEIILDNTDNWLVVIPKDKETSQNLASDAHWCTSTKTGNNLFDYYVGEKLTTLIYLISKTWAKEKYAIRFNMDGKIIDLRDNRNTNLPEDGLEFKNVTGYDPRMLISQARNSPKWREFITSLEFSPLHMNIKLIECARNGDFNGAKYWIDCGADVHADNDDSLSAAANKGHIAIVKLLLDHGADIHEKDDCALLWSSNKGHIEIVKLLLDHGANIHADYDSVLQSASNNNQLEIVKLLLVYSLKINEPFSSKIIEKCIKGTWTQEIKELLTDYMETLE